MQWYYHSRAFSDHVGPISLVLIHDRRGTTLTATSAATGQSERDLSGVSVNGGMRMTTEVLRGKRADLVVVIQSPKVEPEMAHFSWYIPVDACARGWCEPNVIHSFQSLCLKRTMGGGQCIEPFLLTRYISAFFSSFFQ